MHCTMPCYEHLPEMPNQRGSPIVHAEEHRITVRSCFGYIQTGLRGPYRAASDCIGSQVLRRRYLGEPRVLSNPV